MIEGETPATHFKLWIFHILSIFNLIQYWFNHIHNFLVFLQLALAASNNAYHYTHKYLYWQDAPIAYWEVLKEKDRNGNCECNTEGGGYVAKLMPEGIAKSFARVPGIEVERHETDENGGNEHPIDIHKDSYADGHKADDFLYYLKIKEDVATTQYLKHV